MASLQEYLQKESLREGKVCGIWSKCAPSLPHLPWTSATDYRSQEHLALSWNACLPAEGNSSTSHPVHSCLLPRLGPNWAQLRSGDSLCLPTLFMEWRLLWVWCTENTEKIAPPLSAQDSSFMAQRWVRGLQVLKELPVPKPPQALLQAAKLAQIS